MSSLSDPPPGELSELPVLPAQSWAWQPPPHGPPEGRGQAGSGEEAEPKVASGAGGVSLGSAGDSPDCPWSSSPSPASPGGRPPALGGGGTSRGAPPPRPGSPARRAELPPPSLTEASPAGGAAEDSSEGDSDEDEREEELEPCFMGRAEQQRKAMRRAMSECSHLSVPTSLELPGKYPEGTGAAPGQPASPVGAPRRSPRSMKRSLTVAEDPSRAPPPTLSAAGAAHSDLRQAPSPFPPLKDGGAGFPLAPPEAPGEEEPAGSGGRASSSPSQGDSGAEEEPGRGSDPAGEAEIGGSEADPELTTGAGRC